MPSTVQPTARRCATTSSAGIGMPATVCGRDAAITITGGGGGVADHGVARGRRRAAVLDEQVDAPLQGHARDVRVHPALEPFGRLAGQLVPAGGTGDRTGIPVRRLEHDVGRARPDLGGRAAHRSGERDGSGVVGDDEIVRIERAHDVVQRCQPLAGTRAPHAERAGQLRAVEGVQRLTGLEHDVVRDVDRQRDRAHPALPQPVREPRRRRCGRVETGDRARREPVAAGGILDTHGIGRAVDGRAPAQPSRGTRRPDAAAASRASPRIDMQYPRSVVTAMSSTPSRSPSTSIASSPGLAGSSGPRRPARGSPRVRRRYPVRGPSRSSRPRRGRRSCAPRSRTRRAGRRRATRRRRDRLRRSSTRRRRCRAAPPRRRPPSTSGSSCRSSAARPSKESTRPTTSGPEIPSAPDSTRSTSMPTRSIASPSSRGVMPAGRSTCSASQLTGALMLPSRRRG